MTDLEDHLIKQVELQRLEIIRLTNIIFKLTGIEIGEIGASNETSETIKRHELPRTDRTPKNWNETRRNLELMEYKRAQAKKASSNSNAVALEEQEIIHDKT